MPPHQIVQLLPLYGSLANQYPQYIPLIIALSQQPLWRASSLWSAAWISSNTPISSRPRHSPIFPSRSRHFATYPSTHSRIIFKNLREVFLKKVKVTDIMLAFLNLKYEKKF
ncbi:unnamed protein product [Meloidogyne enterolobii]|uniref:Uncharacterized protein n=1 Tax=Meloidogyne enterolobii TaxID=390850 RepID=A0ACB1AGJ6_MELEN